MTVEEPGAAEKPVPQVRAGMVISLVTREDVVVMDPDRFMAAARRAYLAGEPDRTEGDAVAAVADVYDAVFALVGRYGSLASADPEVAAGATVLERMSGGLGHLPGDRVTGRADGLSPAGAVSKVLVDRSAPLQDYGCFLPGDEELFAAADE
ncbi:hypothetical protein Dvina_25450 [Dactylosporangium vinaceum]|uniref:Uncharacterized protein n=1 Tax=Dactylosporangium vinaceum TaxID=53362 RepID=A0ABV5MDP2_9ACTN|nr:hypothetical protein [Dactylosporangium vinaceum]UAC01104.1 hypothetical protein Dvina_25450 [Dactylosporangium vinaceum]